MGLVPLSRTDNKDAGPRARRHAWRCARSTINNTSPCVVLHLLLHCMLPQRQCSYSTSLEIYIYTINIPITIASTCTLYLNISQSMMLYYASMTQPQSILYSVSCTMARAVRHYCSNTCDRDKQRLLKPRSKQLTSQVQPYTSPAPATRCRTLVDQAYACGKASNGILVSTVQGHWA